MRVPGIWVVAAVMMLLAGCAQNAEVGRSDKAQTDVAREQNVRAALEASPASMTLPQVHDSDRDDENANGE
jgi:hypothetical protein